MNFPLLPSAPFHPARLFAAAGGGGGWLGGAPEIAVGERASGASQRGRTEVSPVHTCVLKSVAPCLQSSCGLTQWGTENYYFKSCCWWERSTKSQWTIDPSYCVWSLSNAGGILYSLVTTSKTWAVVAFCPLILGKSRKIIATKNVESSYRSCKIHILPVPWIYFISCLWLGAIYLWNKRKFWWQWEVIFYNFIYLLLVDYWVVYVLTRNTEDPLKNTQWATSPAGIWCDNIL